MQIVPAQMRNRQVADDVFHFARQKAQPIDIPFFAVLKQELHPETDADERLCLLQLSQQFPQTDCIDPLDGILEMSHTRQDDDIRLA